MKTQVTRRRERLQSGAAATATTSSSSSSSSMLENGDRGEAQPLTGGGKATNDSTGDVATAGAPPTMSTGELLRSGNFWRVVAFMSFVLFVSQQWRFMDLLMPKYTTRCYGEDAPFAAIAYVSLAV